MSTSDQIQMIVCQRCGRGLILTSTYRAWLARRGAKAVVPVLCPTCFLRKGPKAVDVVVLKAGSVP